MKIFLRDTVTTLVLAAVIVLGLRVVIQSSVVVSPSMEPSLKVGQRIIINKIAYAFSQPQRGDIIVFHPPGNETDDYVKRIIGLPNESVEITDGIVYIHKEDGSVLPLNEPYITDQPRNHFKGGAIPEDEYFVLGDYRNNSSDSRGGWTLPRQNIIGKAWLTIWPPEEWGLAPNYPLQESIDKLISQ